MRVAEPVICIPNHLTGRTCTALGDCANVCDAYCKLCNLHDDTNLLLHQGSTCLLHQGFTYHIWKLQCFSVKPACCLLTGCVFFVAGDHEGQRWHNHRGQVPHQHPRTCHCGPLSGMLCLSVCLPACLSVCLPVCLSVRLSVCLSACLSVSLSLGLYTYQSDAESVSYQILLLSTRI